MLSIIIPTFQSHGLLDQAINSVQVQTVPDWEIVISPDDGLDYSYLQARDARIRVVQSTAVATGAGPTRNRALAQVLGTAVAYLDDDDELSSNYVEAVLNVLDTELAVVVPTRYDNIRTIGLGSKKITITQFGKMLGSLHVATRREHFPKWLNCFAEDVVHTCCVIEQQGGTIRVIADAEYVAHVRDTGMCATNKNINSSYDAIIQQSTHKETTELFQYRKRVNQLYEQSGQTQNYHEFVRHLTTNEINSIIHF